MPQIINNITPVSIYIFIYFYIFLYILYILYFLYFIKKQKKIEIFFIKLKNLIILREYKH